jgi:prepilin peptidase CpaA
MYHKDFFPPPCGLPFYGRKRQDAMQAARECRRMSEASIWVLAVFIAVWAGVLDWRFKRIPNWLTVSGLVAGLALNSWLNGWAGLKASLLGAALGLGVLLPFVLLRALGGGDWKLVGALGAILGAGRLVDVLIVAIIVAGVMAAVLVIATGRIRDTLHNIWGMLGSFARMQMPGPEVSLDNPESKRIPFGVSVTIAVALYGAREAWLILGKA